jgi:hypothetical protein
MGKEEGSFEELCEEPFENNLLMATALSGSLLALA